MIDYGLQNYLVNRYDSVTGMPEPDLNHRIGLLDRKLRVVSESTQDIDDWLDWANVAVKSVYGFEWQGDNLLLAREAVLFTVIEYFRGKFNQPFPENALKGFAYVISWNLWQMDGLKMVIPYSCHEESAPQMDFFAEPKKTECPACAKGLTAGHNGIKCMIRDWKKTGDGQTVLFESLVKNGECREGGKA